MTAESVFTRDRLIRAAQLSMAQTFYLTTMNQFVGNNPDAWPSQTTIANAMNAAPRSVRKWQAELEAIGVIQVQVGKGRSSTNRYRLNLNSLPLNEEPHAYRKNNKDPKKNQGVIFPAELQSDAFRDSWESWSKHRREIRKKLTPSTVAKQLTKLSRIGEQRAVAAIDHSIEKGYTGIFEPSDKTQPASSAAVVTWEQLVSTIASMDICAGYSQQIAAKFGQRVADAAKAVGVPAIKEADSFALQRLRKSFLTHMEGRA